MHFPEPHPFARFVAILGRGKSKTRSLTRQEARDAMAMILARDVLPEQLGAFLMLLRVKEETGEEIAGFVDAVRACVSRPAGAPPVDLDWPSYAGKSRQLPWFLLAALLLAKNGKRILMHGLDGHTKGRVYSGAILARLGAPVARDLDEAATLLARANFAYLSLEAISPRTAELVALKPILGLRSSVHTLVRALNPFDAAASLQGVFHPGYMDIHRDAALLLDHGRTIVFRGDGGEGERRPNKPAQILTIADGAATDERWAATTEDQSQAPDESMDVGRLAAVWSGEARDAYGEAAVVGTTALALHALGAADGPDEAQAMAAHMWRSRAGALPAAAG
ncbi:MAG: glycosyl transferase family protein [Hyphomicrobiales bacterium]|nr:glycosyl transferase family protein [Hyphomicrobiales bacterium]